MTDERPLRHERLWAAATFAGIGLATLMALDFLVTGGFDFGAQRSRSSPVDPLGANVVAAPAPSTVTALAWTDPAVADPIDPAMADKAQPAEEASEESADEPTADVAAPSEDELYREIANLNAEQDARAAHGAEREQAQVLDDAEADEPALYDERDLNPDPTAPDSQF